MLDEGEREEDDIAQSHLFKTERLELLRECKVIFWDEFVSNHHEVFEAVVNEYETIQFLCAPEIFVKYYQLSMVHRTILFKHVLVPPIIGPTLKFSSSLRTCE